jgi:hypothetical protein
MTGLSGQEYAGKYEADARRQHGARHNLGGPPGRMIIAFVVALVLIYFAVDLLGARSSADANGSILKASGCAAYNIEPVNFEPSMPLEEAEDAVRKEIVERSLRAADGEGANQTFDPGSLYSAKYGHLSRPTQGRSPDPQTSDRHWVFIFEDERDAPWYSGVWRRPSGPRFTVVYSPEQDRITSYCGGYSS